MPLPTSDTACAVQSRRKSLTRQIAHSVDSETLPGGLPGDRQSGTDPLPGHAPPSRLGDPAVERVVHLRATAACAEAALVAERRRAISRTEAALRRGLRYSRIERIAARTVADIDTRPSNDLCYLRRWSSDRTCTGLARQLPAPCNHLRVRVNLTGTVRVTLTAVKADRTDSLGERRRERSSRRRRNLPPPRPA